jgi:transposase InsO family protein
MKGRSASIAVSSLYVILDVYSRYAVGWLVAPHESDRLAQELIAACAEQIPAGPAWPAQASSLYRRPF